MSKAAKEMMDWSFKSRALPETADNIKPKISLTELSLARISSMRICRGQMQSLGASFSKSYFFTMSTGSKGSSNLSNYFLAAAGGMALLSTSWNTLLNLCKTGPKRAVQLILTAPTNTTTKAFYLSLMPVIAGAREVKKAFVPLASISASLTCTPPQNISISKVQHAVLE